jgi:glycine betaine/choline ABC-type transport system substrate-binding protein
LKPLINITVGAALAAAIAMAGAAPSGACVGRTLFIGYFDAPEQTMVANILSVFIDERTGTTVKLSRFHTRAEAFEAVRKDRVSIYADYSTVLLGMLPGERPAPDHEKNFMRLKDILSREYNVVLLEPFGYDRYFSGKPKAGERPGQAGVMVCKDAISKFPALPKLLAKLRGALDNETMAALLAEAEKSDPKTVARRFLKSRKLI